MNLHIGQLTLPIHIEHTERKSIGVTVTPNKKIRVRAPQQATKKEILKALQKKKPWILKTTHKLDQEKPKPKQKELLSGQKLRYKGRQYRLKAHKGKTNKLTFQNSTFTLTYTHIDKKHQTVTQWFKDKAQQHLTERGQYYIQKIEPAPTTVTVKPIQAWGKYKQKNITLHPRLIHAPQHIIDYVIIHECIHAKHNHHGKQFWNHVKTHIPDYKKRREWLRKNGNILLP